MTDRAAQIAGFLAAQGLAGWSRAAITGDASTRRYERLTGPNGEKRILMDAPPEAAGPIDPFLKVAAHLQNAGLRAPRIDRADPAAGLILMEDFGDMLVARQAAAHPDQEPDLYASSALILAQLHGHPPMAGLTALDPAEGARLVAEVASWIPGDPGRTRDVVTALQAALGQIIPETPVMALRDYHAENLVCCPDGDGLNRIGLLDFQDAVLASEVYDLVSLIRDVRRDVSPRAARAAVAAFAAAKDTTPDALAPAIAVQGVQRNLRILGIFHRLAQRDGKRRYLDFLPRLKRLLLMDLTHPDLEALAKIARPLIEEGSDAA